MGEPKDGLDVATKRKNSFHNENPAPVVQSIQNELSPALKPYTRAYPKVSRLAAWSENCKW
jgi:hypothetical protein